MHRVRRAFDDDEITIVEEGFMRTRCFQLAPPLSIIGRKQNLLDEGYPKVMSFRDPVCGAVLDENTAKFKITYNGETYHFCSLVCKKRFKRHKTKFIK